VSKGHTFQDLGSSAWSDILLLVERVLHQLEHNHRTNLRQCVERSVRVFEKVASVNAALLGNRTLLGRASSGHRRIAD